MIADRILKLLQAFYTQERTFMIVGPNPNGKHVPQKVTINKESDDGSSLINDITVGKYDVVIADVPTQITFQNAQFSQAIELRKYGVQIPDDEMVLMSTLSRKVDIAKKLSGDQTPEQQQQAQLQVETMKKTIEDMESKAKAKNAEALKQIADVATLIAANPKLSPLMDALLSTLDSDESTESPNEQDQAPSVQPAQPQQLGQT
jgi:hypothetical protein